MRLFMLACLFVLTLSACGKEENSLFHQQEDQAGTNMINNQASQAEKKELNDRVDLYQNPNFLDLSSDTSKVGTDVDKAREVIKIYTDYRPGNVWVNGNRMQVTVYAENPREVNQAAVRKKLVKALPRYDIDVEVKAENR
ncbi:hypothetical protein JOC78_001288 [Bacillus ectoiniformans]|uniref:hypothetical protein n=1 Tax=Bacillus ectoiniformans TaxID=1494429 RepID=UPI0019567FA8|nr:hypothetical protein [Bacillus ectoiniformans]MBM7648346.1 hypothetical protein [Bacillus ectoiniformans]